MLFNSLDFLVFFFIVLGAIGVFHYRKFQHLFLMLSSLFFLYYTDNYLVTQNGGVRLSPLNWTHKVIGD